MTFARTVITASLAALVFAGAPLAAEGMMKRSGTITIDETQFGFLLGGNTGGGRLMFKGTPYRFKIGGISVGDIGVSKVKGYGTVYNLKSVSEFAGTYTKLDASATAFKGSGAIRLKNDQGVVLEIDTHSKGLQLSAGAGGVKITLE